MSISIIKISFAPHEKKPKFPIGPHIAVMPGPVLLRQVRQEEKLVRKSFPSKETKATAIKSIIAYAVKYFSTEEISSLESALPFNLTICTLLGRRTFNKFA